MAGEKETQTGFKQSTGVPEGAWGGAPRQLSLGGPSPPRLSFCAALVVRSARL